MRQVITKLILSPSLVPLHLLIRSVNRIPTPSLYHVMYDTDKKISICDRRQRSELKAPDPVSDVARLDERFMMTS